MVPQIQAASDYKTAGTDGTFREATGKFRPGRFGEAERRLNPLCSVTEVHKVHFLRPMSLLMETSVIK